MTGPPGTRPVRLADVARDAGVHPSVVSRVLNEDPSLSIRAETAARIRDVARRSGYRPNAVARALRGARTGSLGMVVPLLRNPIWTTVQAGALRRAEERGYVVMITEQRIDVPRPIADFRWLVEQHRVDGLMFATSLRTHRAVESRPGVPHVFLNRRGATPGNDVVMDEARAVRLVVDHAVARGHSRLIMLDGPKNIDTVWRRVREGRRLATAHGLRLEVVHTEQTEEEGFAAVQRIAGARARPTLCAVGSVNQLIGVLAGLHRSGLRMPEDVSVVSFDEDDMLAYLPVPVTSVAMPLAELGVAAVDALIARITGAPAEDVVVDAPMTLIERASVATRTSSP